MMKLGLLLLITVHRTAAADDHCGCDGKCSNPTLDWKTDCPSYGFDCQRSHAALALFKRHGRRDDVTLECADSNAELFVKGKSQKKLKCRKSSGKWMRSDGCDSTDSALCALPCSTCSTRVPSFLSMDAVSVSVLPASEERPCSIGFCTGDGLTLIGTNSVNSSTIIDGNVTCVGSGWMDGNGRVYSYAVCGYYSCPVISMATPSPDTLPVISTGSRSLSCPVGSLLSSAKDANGNSLQTKYPLICSSGNKWQLYGVSWDSEAFTDLTCIPYEPCTINIALPSSCTDDSCVPVTQTIVPYGTGSVTLLSCKDSDSYILGSDDAYVLVSPVICSGQQIIEVTSMNEHTNIGCRKAAGCSGSLDAGSEVCQNDLSLCSPVLQSGPTAFTCPPGSRMIAVDYDGNYIAIAGNLSCIGGGYVDTGLWYADGTTYAAMLTCITTTTRADLSCQLPPMMFIQNSISLESPPDSAIHVSRPTLERGDDGELVLLFNTDYLIYYNNSMTNVALQLQCGKDGLWHAPDNTVVTTATSMYTACVDKAHPAPKGATPLSLFGDFYACSPSILYQFAGDDTVHVLNSDLTIPILCSPGGNFALPFENGYFVVPFDTKIGCSAS